MQVRTILVVMLAPLILLSGCAHRQSAKRFNKKQLSYHLTEQTADDSKAIDNIRVSCKKSPYIKKSDCTLVHMTIDNKSDSTCSFNRSDLKLPLLAQTEAEKVVRSSGFRKVARAILPASIGFAACLAPSIWLISDGAWELFLVTVPIGMILGTVLGISTYFITKAIIPDTSNKYDIAYINENKARKIIFPNEIQSMLLLAKGELNQTFEISLQTNHGQLDYALELDKQ